MAEQVQATLDQMVAPLADLMDRKIFSQSEIHAIVARRRESEYLLRRRAPRKADFLKYIQDELQLEQLRQLRTKQQNALERERMEKLGRLQEYIQQKARDYKKKHIGDPHIIQTIHLLFRRTLRRYNKEDISIYLQYADVCKELQSYTKLPQVYAEAVQIHPHVTGLWIEAASHEFFHRQSVGAARILLQRALRINPKAKELWWQSFALEFHYMAKLQGRKAMLHQGDTSQQEEEQQGDTTNLTAVAKIVYDGAIQAIPDDVSFRLHFLDLCQKFPSTQAMEAHIFQTICRDFQDSPKAWIARATHLQEGKNLVGDKGFAVAPPEDEKGSKKNSSDDNDSGSSSDESGSSSSGDDDSDKEERPSKKPRTTESTHSNPVLAMIQKAIQAVPSTEMYLEAVHFLWSYWEKAEEETDEDKMEELRQEILHFLQELLDEAAARSNSYTVALALEHAEFYTRVDQVQRARQVLTDFKEASIIADKDNEGSVRLTPIWLQLAELTYQEESAADAHQVLKEALKHTPMSHADYVPLLLHLLGIELVMEDQETSTKRGTSNNPSTETFRKVLLLAGGRSEVAADEDSEEQDETMATSFGIKSAEQGCWQFLLHMMDKFGPLGGVRRTCKIVLKESKFIDNQDAQTMQEIETLVAFFDKCLEVEIANLKKKGTKQSKSERKKGKLCMRQLFDAAIRLFHNVPSLASKYQQERLDASLL